jgi:hypothetical protein
MNNALPKIAFFIFVSIVAVYVTIGLFTGGNALGNLYQFLAIGAIIFAVIAPRQSVWLLIVETAYLDFFKRLMTVAGNPDWLDIALVLAIAPLTSVGILVGVIGQYILGSLQLKRYHGLLLGISLMVFGFNFLILSTDGLNLSVLKDLANRGSYVFLIFTIPALFGTVDEIRSFLTGILLTYIPVLGYLIYQSVAGLTDWEYRYMMSGYSMEIRQFRNAVFRPFSTLNSAANLSTMMAVMVVLCFGPLKFAFLRSPAMRVFLAVMFAFGSYLTLSRGGWVCGLTALACVVLFKSKWSTTLAYIGGAVLVVTTIFSAEWMMRTKFLDDATSVIGSYGSGERYSMATRLGTFDARLRSYRELVNNSDYWNPFGVIIAGKATYSDLKSTTYEDRFFSHDFITETLLLIGYIPMAVLAVFLCVNLFKVHRYLLDLPRGPTEQATRFCVAFTVGIGIGALANSAQLQTFPISTFFWLFIAMPAALRLTAKPQQAEENEERSQRFPKPSPQLT